MQHFLVFGLYVLSTLTLYYTDFNYYLSDGSLAALCVSIAVSNVFSFIEQLFICHIFWQLGSKPNVPDVQDEPSELESPVLSSGVPETVEYDAEQEAQARIWGQFMRKNEGSSFTYTVLKTFYKDSTEGVSSLTQVPESPTVNTDDSKVISNS